MKFDITDKIKGFYFVIDENNNKVGITCRDGKLRVKKFKTVYKAAEFAAKLEVASNLSKENTLG